MKQSETVIYKNLKTTRALHRAEEILGPCNHCDSTGQEPIETSEYPPEPCSVCKGRKETSRGHRSIPDGQEEITYAVLLDFDGLQAMAKRAAKSKGQRSSDGPLTVVIQGRKKL